MGQRDNINDYDIQALIDNELEWEQEKHIRAFIEHNSVAKSRYEELKEQKMLLQKWASKEFFQ